MKILHLDSSAQHEQSRGRALARELVNALGQRQPTEITYRDLSQGVPFLSETSVGAAFTDEDQRTPEQKAALAPGDTLIEELEAADALVLSVPVYNFGVPAVVKAWIDQVARARRTFRYTADGPEGLLKGKRAYLVVTSGGTALGSPADFATPWLRFVLGFMGITDVEIIDASRLVMDAESQLASARKQIIRLAEAPAAAQAA